MTRAPGEGGKERNATPLWFAQILEIGKSTEIYTSHQQRTSGKAVRKTCDFEAQRPSQVIRSMCILDLMVWWPQHHFTENGPKGMKSWDQMSTKFISRFSVFFRRVVWSYEAMVKRVVRPSPEEEFRGVNPLIFNFEATKIGKWPPLSYSSGSWEQHPASVPSDWLRKFWWAFQTDKDGFQLLLAAATEETQSFGISFSKHLNWQELKSYPRNRSGTTENKASLNTFRSTVHPLYMHKYHDSMMHLCQESHPLSQNNKPWSEWCTCCLYLYCATSACHISRFPNPNRPHSLATGSLVPH